MSRSYKNSVIIFTQDSKACPAIWKPLRKQYAISVQLNYNVVNSVNDVRGTCHKRQNKLIILIILPSEVALILLLFQTP